MIEEGKLLKKKQLKTFHKNRKDQIGASLVAKILDNPKIILTGRSWFCMQSASQINQEYSLILYCDVKNKCKCNLFIHRHQGVHKNPLRNVCAFQDRIGIWKCWFLRRGENRSTRRKTSRSREENQQQTQPTYDSGSGNRTRDTLVGGERSHHCAIPAPLIKYWIHAH